jgi:hypothetical protein
MGIIVCTDLVFEFNNAVPQASKPTNSMVASFSRQEDKDNLLIITMIANVPSIMTRAVNMITFYHETHTEACKQLSTTIPLVVNS